MNETEIKINRIVNYIKQFAFEYEIDEVKENINGILADFKIYDILSEKELEILSLELEELADEFEIGEAIRLALQHEPINAFTPRAIPASITA